MVRQGAMLALMHSVRGKPGRWTGATLATVLALAPGAGLAEDAPKSRWFDRMETVLPTKLCGEQQYFRQCFEVDAKQCERTMASATRNCVRQIESDVPDELDRQSGKKWGERLGQCAGETYETSLADKRIDSQRCNNADNWL